MDRIYGYEMTTTSGGNLSLVDEESRMWITPARVDKGGLQERDIVNIDVTGKISGAHPPSSEYPFHRQIYEVRPDIKAIIHAHPVALVAFSVVRQIPDVKGFTKAFKRCGKVALAPYALPGSEALGKNIADQFKAGADVAILENHGVVVGGTTLEKAYERFELLEFYCRALIQASRIGTIRVMGAKEQELLDNQPAPLPGLEAHVPTTPEKEARAELARFIRRGYEHGLFTGVQGTFSARLSPDEFLITPRQADRREVSAADLCYVKGGLVEPGREASRGVQSHLEIYRQQPEVRSIINAAPPSALGFAMTNESLNSRTIPESYIFLREVPRLTIAEVYGDPVAVAKKVSLKQPVSLVDNEGVLVVAGSVFEAFDRLEVTEATAQSLVEATTLGAMCPMDDAAIDELKSAFGLKD
jgi:L-fuculose-phosphate aldolase